MGSPARMIAAALLGGALLILAPAAHAAGVPEVTDTWAAAVGVTGVDLHAEVNPGELQTSVQLEYLTAAAYSANLTASPPRDGFDGAIVSPSGGAPIGAGNVAVEFSRHIGGLKPASAYRYRFAATNSEGTELGPTRPFATRPNASASFSLLDARGWEMVSPVDKNGGAVQSAGANFGGGVLQAAADGNSTTYSSAFSFAAGQGAPGASQYISRRAAGGWSTENVTTATEAGTYGPDPDGVPYQLFSGDLARGLIFNPRRCTGAPCPREYLLRQNAGAALSASPQAGDLTFVGTTPDLAHLVLSSCAALSANATEVPGAGGACDPAEPNLYEWSGAGLTLINLLPGATQSTPGASLGAQSGAVSADGSRVYFSVAGNLYLRNGAQSVQVDATLGGGGVFAAASADGAIAFFSKAGHLYRYALASGAVSDLTPGGGVQGVLGASTDGAYLYYLSDAGLFLDHAGQATKVAADADASNYPPTAATARVAANGNLVFLSSAPLTEADSGAFSEVFLYSPAAASLTCVSCNPTGARPTGPSSIPGAVANGTLPSATRLYKPRALSAAGNRVFFDSADALVPTDTNNDQDVYEWEAQGVGSCTEGGGCLNLISSGRSTEGASFIDASADGSDAFFLTDGSLVPTDPGAADVYDARVGGGFPVPTPSIPCVADECQVIPPEPEDPSPGTAFFRPEANPPVSFPKAKRHKKHKPKKHRKTAHKKHHRPAKRGGRS